MSKAPKKSREKSKTSTWERERRNRINDYFKKLCEVLPIYDASKPLSKPDILIHAASTIKDLDEKLKKILESSDKEKQSEEKLKVSSDLIKKLQDRVKKLLLRNEQLTHLVRNAGIKVPSECGIVKKFKKTLKYTNAVTAEQQANILQKELEKENQAKVSKPRSSKSSLKSKKVFTRPKSRKSKKQLLSTPNCLFVVSQPTGPSNSCFILSKTPAKINQTVMTNSLLVKAPIVSSDIKPSIFPTYPQLSGLNPGTLVFADVTMMPVIPPRPLPVLPTLFTNPVPTQLSTLIMVSSKNNTNSSCANKMSVSADSKMPLTGSLRNLDTISSTVTKNSSINGANRLPVLKPKSNITKTTQVNKVPIPALSSKYNKHTCLGSKNTQIDQQKTAAKTPVNEKAAEKITPECTQNEAKKLKLASDEGAKKIGEPIDKIENQETAVVETSTSSIQSTRKPAETNKETPATVSKPENPKQTSIETAEVNTHQAVKVSTNNLSQGPISEAPESHQGISASLPTVGSLPTQAYVDNNSKIMATHEITKSNNALTMKNVSETNVTAATEPEPTKIVNESNSEPFKTSEVLTANTTNFRDSYEFETYTDIASQPNITSREREIIPNVTRNVPVNVTKQTDVGHLSSDAQTNSLINNNIATTSSLTKSSDTLQNAKYLEMRMQQKSYTGISSCLKQDSKQFELTNLQTAVVPTQNSNMNTLKSLEMNLPQTEFSNDIFASFQVPPGCQNPESTSPTAAFLLAFPLVSSGVKVAEVIGDENCESQAGTPNLLQIGTMDLSKSTQSYSDSLTPNLLNFDNFSFFNNKDNCGGFYNNCSMINTTCQPSISGAVTSSSKVATSFASSNVIQDQLNSLNQQKSSAGFKFPTTIHYNKGEIISNKPSNQNNNKIDSNVKDSRHKYPNYHDNLGLPQVAKAQAQNIDKTVSTSQVQINTNVLDINPDVFSFKATPNDNYLCTNKHNNSGPMYTSKPSSDVPNYSNYKGCNSTVSNQFVANKHYPPVYTSASIGNTFYNSFGTEGDNRNFSSTNCNNHADYNRKSFSNICNANTQNMYQKEKPDHNMQNKVKAPSQNKPINWMTAPTTTASYKPDYFLPPFSKDPAFNSNLVPTTLPSNTYFSSSVYNPNEHLNITQDFRKSSDMPLPTYSSYQRTEPEENQFSWSPNKMPQFLDTAHAHTFVSSTLPTLVGDLALNNTLVDQKSLKDRGRDNRRKPANCDNQSGQSSFLSVSQLVEQTQENVPAKVASRRNSGNRSKTSTMKAKRTNGRSEPNKDMQNFQKNEKSNFNISVATNLFNENNKQPSRNNNKNIPSSYSAEALIGNQGSNDTSAKRNSSCQNKAIVPSFFNDNMLSYFPSVEAPQDNSYMHNSQNYQSNSFSQNFTTTFQNNSYSTNNFIPSSCTITSSYIPTNNFMPNANTQDFAVENTNLFQNSNAGATKDKCNFTKNYYRPEKDDKNQSYSCKKAKKRPLNDNVLPSFDIHFFSMPGAINSPILPDDFHTTYLPPTTLYSCKNPLYSKSTSEAIPSSLIPPLPAISGNKPVIQHPQMSPTVNSAGTSLTNFNLSTIFPEINKGPIQETFADNRNNPVSKSFSMSSSHQVPFSNKSSIIF